MRANFTRYADIDSIVKNDDGTIIVHGIASSGAVDSDGEIITPDAMKAAIPDYMKFGAVREMHGKSAAGTALEAEVQEDGRTAFSALVVDPIAIKKVEAGVYKGFSIGGKVNTRDGNTITSLKLIEVSLVDRPANPEALITMYKSEEVEEKPVEQIESTEKTEETEVKKSLWTVSRFADLLGSVASLAQSEAWDANYEGDSSPIPSALREWFSQGAAIFQAMAAEEITETLNNINALIPAPLEIVEMSASAETEKSESTEVEKAGSKYSAATKAALAEIHKGMNDLCAKMGALGYDQTDETKDDGVEMSAGTEMNKFESLEKSISDLKSDLEKAMGETKEAKELLAKADARIKHLESQPETGKAILKTFAVTKDGDNEKAESAPPPKEGTPEYNDYLMKNALSNPIQK